jgi:hypothetical protein
MRVNKRRIKALRQPYARIQGGSGLVSNIGSLFSKTYSTVLNNIDPSDDTGRPSFQGEKHAILKLKNGKLGVANYMGPGTHVAERIARGDPPRTLVDTVAMGHDLRYFKAKTTDDIRYADNKMLTALKTIKKNRSDSRMNIAQGNLIALKVSLENKGIMNKGSFGELKDKTRKMTPAMDGKLFELSQAGYGKPTTMPVDDPIKTLRKRMLKFSMK